VEFNPPWNFIANRGEIRPKKDFAEGEAKNHFSDYTIMRDLLKKGLTYYQQNPE